MSSPSMHDGQKVDLNIGMPLYTRDGRRAGNARVASETQHPVFSHAVFGITTDAGQNLVLSEREVDDLFYRSPE